MTVPAENISNTVLRRALPLVTPTDPWPMYIVDADQIEVWVEFTPGDVVEQLPATYNIQINPTSYWEFVFTWTTPPGPVGGTQLIIFRRTRGVVNQFPPGSFLTAEALNLRFDLDNLSINDTAYYQTKTNPSYSKQTIASHGVFDPIPATDSNPALNQDDLDLPYLGTGAPAPDEVYTWGKKIDNIGFIGHGHFKQVLIESPSGGGTVAQLKQELADCSTVADQGGHLIGLRSVPNPAMGWPGVCQTLAQWYINMSKSGTVLDAGATQVGFRSDTGVHVGEYSVQNFLSKFEEKGTPGNYALDSGGSYIGYEGWSVSNNTVAGCLSRLNGPATSAADSGAAYVQWWTGTASESVQDALEDALDRINKISNVYVYENFTIAPIGPIIALPALPAPFDEVDNLRMVNLEWWSSTPQPVLPAGGGRLISLQYPANFSAQTYDALINWSNIAQTNQVGQKLIKGAGATPGWSLAAGLGANAFIRSENVRITFYLTSGP